MRIVLASENAHKISEIRAILLPLIPGLELASLKDFPGLGEIPEETGTTFRDNAAQKAGFVAKATGLPSIGDDSGLCVDALNGAPGIYSRRWAEEGATDADRIAKLLQAMSATGAVGASQRGATFVCATALAWPSGSAQIALGECPGIILDAARGANGFGYDPVFFLPQSGKTMAELSAGEKNAISHRARSIRNLAPFLRECA